MLTQTKIGIFIGKFSWEILQTSDIPHAYYLINLKGIGCDSQSFVQ